MPVVTRSQSKVQAQYPCVSCGISVGEQDSICCDTCNKWIHFECTNLSRQDFDFHCQNDDEPFHCVFCKPSTSSNDIINPTLPSANAASEPSTTDPCKHSTSNATTDGNLLQEPSIDPVYVYPVTQTELDSSTSLMATSNLSFNSDDFEYVSDSDEDDLRGLNFLALPSTKVKTTKSKSTYCDRPITIHTRKYKYPCLVCGNACREKTNCISCVLCDEWVHLKCTDLTLEQFHIYTSPEHIDKPYYCVNCLFGNYVDHELERPDQSSHSVLTTLLDSSDIPKYCPNSIFKDKDASLSPYLTIEELNRLTDVQVKKTPDDILLVHVNAVSLVLNFDKIFDTLAELRPCPSIIFLTETRLQDPKLKDQLSKAKLKDQLSKVTLNGYTMVYNNSKTQAGGTAIYVSNNLKYVERPDIKFDHPNCEACFIETLCENEIHNHIFGALYRHPTKQCRAFSIKLSEFLETFTSRKTKLTILGDINIDLNKSNVASIEYINAVNSAGFAAMINQPTRIFYYEDSHSVSCSTIDHLITNSSPCLSRVGILVTDVSDHLPIFGLLSLKKPCFNPLKIPLEDV